MTVPTPTNEYLDLTIAPFTANGSPTEIDDQHTSSSAYTLDDVDDYLSSSVTPFAAGPMKFSVSMWVRIDNLGTVNRVASNWATTPTATNTVFYFGFDSSDRLSLNIRDSDTGGALNSTSGQAITDNSWHLITATCEDPSVSNDINLYIDGVVVSSYLQQDNVSGTRPTTWVLPSTLGIGGLYNDSWISGFGGGISRWKSWDGTVLSAAQVLEEYNNEVASILPTKLGFESHRYDFDEVSGAIQDKVGTSHATTTTVTTYNGTSVTMDGVDDKIIFPSGIFNATSDVSGYIAFKFLDNPAANFQFWSMSPNGFSPAIGWLGASLDSHSVDINNTGPTRVDVAHGGAISNSEIYVYAFSYKVSTRLISLAVEGSNGTSLTGTQTESVELPVDVGVKLGVNGPESAFCNMQIYQVGTFTTQYDTADLTTTAAALVAEIVAAIGGATGGIIPTILGPIIPSGISTII